MKSRPHPVHLLLLLVLGAAVAAVLLPGRRAREDAAGLLRDLRASAGPSLPLPAGAGATGATDPARYDRERLYELVDGAAEAILARGFEACVARTYAFEATTGPFEIAAECYRFASEDGAREQLQAERPRSARELTTLPGAVTDGAVLLAVRRRDLLKLTALTSDPRGGEALLELARAWKELRP